MADVMAIVPATLKPDVPSAVVKSAGRVLQILEFFDAVQREARVTEISRALHYPQSSTSVLLRSLVDMGYLQHDRYRRSYYPTRRVSLLGNWVDPAMVQQGRLLAQANKLASATERTVVIASANGLHAQYIYVSRSIEDTAPESCAYIGELRPITTVAVGKALLSTMGDDHVSKLVRRINAERESTVPPVNSAEFLAELQLGRKHGYFTGSGAGAGQSAIAIPLLRDRQLLAIGMEACIGEIFDNVEGLALMLRDLISEPVSSDVYMDA